MLEDRFQPNMTVSDISPRPHYACIGGKCTPGSWGNAEVPWPTLELGFSKVTTEWRLRGQWSEGEVLFQQCQSLDCPRSQNSERAIWC